MNDPIESTPLPVWQRPAWITAIVGLVTALLTIPSEVSQFLIKREEIRSAKLENQFNIVNQTLAQQGDERVFVLRYLSKTSEDADARAWAREEVQRLDNIVQLTNQLATARRELRSEVETNTAARARLETEIAELERQVGELRGKAGLSALELSAFELQPRSPEEIARGLALDYLLGRPRDSLALLPAEIRAAVEAEIAELEEDPEWREFLRRMRREPDIQELLRRAEGRMREP